MFAVVENVKADAALALTNGDGALSVSADQTGVPDTAGPPLLMRYLTVGDPPCAPIEGRCKLQPHRASMIPIKHARG